MWERGGTVVIVCGEPRTGRSRYVAATRFMIVAESSRVPFVGRDRMIRAGARSTLAGADAARRQHQQ